MRPRLLVTGFGPFAGARENPTAVLVEELESARWAGLRGVDLIAQVLPVEYGLLDVWAGALDAARPDMILHFGLAPRADAIRIETRAMNRAVPYRPDAAGITPPRVLDPGGPGMLRTNLPYADLRDAIAASGVAVRMSQDAGGYLCNALLYASLAWCRQGRGRAAGFVHVPPWTPAQLRVSVQAGVAALVSRLARRAAS